VSGAFLLDVNVLVAAAWPTHTAHERVRQWLARYAREGWASCPLTQSGFVRILSNPAFSPNALSVTEAISLLQANLAHPAHRFWADEIGFPQAVEKIAPRLTGHQQLSDAYLLGLAIHKRGRLATTDRAILELLAEKSSERERIVLV
jgi:hypothetical protein